MDTRKIERFLKDFGVDILMVVGGLILLLNPDGAAALVTKVIGWFMVLLGAWMLVHPALKNIHISGGTWLHGGLLILVGVVLLAKPLIIADSLGRFFGILLLIEGIGNLKSGVRLLPVLTIAAGVVLVVIPRTLTQTLFAIIGIILIVIGAVNILGKIRTTKRLHESSDPNIIDADM